MGFPEKKLFIKSPDLHLSFNDDTLVINKSIYEWSRTYANQL